MHACVSCQRFMCVSACFMPTGSICVSCVFQRVSCQRFMCVSACFMPTFCRLRTVQFNIGKVIIIFILKVLEEDASLPMNFYRAYAEVCTIPFTTQAF